MERVDHSARSSFAANIAFNLLSWGAPLAIAFVVTPILIRGLGLDGYGYYSFVLAVIGFAFTTGIGRMSAKYIPEERIGKADGQLAKLLSASLYITIAVAAVQGLLIAALAPLLVSEVLLAPQSVQAGLISAIRIACLIGPVLMLSQVFQSATQGLHRFRAFAIITLSAAIFLNAGVIVLVLSGYDIAALFWWNLAVTAIAAVVFALFVLPRVPEFRPMMPDSAAFAKVLRFASSIFIYQSIYSVFCIFERILVVRKFGAEAMTFYAVPLMLGIYLHASIVSISQVAVPTLNEKFENKDELRAFYEAFTRLVLAIATLIAVGYFLVGQLFLALWLGSEFAARSYWLLVIHGLAFTLIAYSIVCWITAEAAHRPGLNALSSSITSITAIVAAAFLSSEYGLEGVAAGRLIGAALVIPLIFYLESRIFGSVQIGFWTTSIWKLAVAAIFACFVSIVFTSLFPNDWFTFGITTVLIAAVFLGVLLVLRFADIDELRRLVKRQAYTVDGDQESVTQFPGNI